MDNGAMVGPDWAVMVDAVGAFLFFLLLHLIFFRFVRHENVPRWLKNFILLAVIANIGVNAWRLKALGLGFLAIVLCSGISVGIMIFLIFIYILGWFGLLESAIRMRLMWELYKVHPRPLTLSDLMKDYNVQTILRGRIGRLTATKEILFDGKNYSLGNQMSFFVFKEWMDGVILGLLKGKK